MPAKPAAKNEAARAIVNELHRSLAGKILAEIRRSAMVQGQHITEQSLQDLLGTSRQPIRAAMAHLAGAGVLRKQPNRGYFVHDPAALSPDDLAPETTAADEAIYLRIAEDRLSRRLGDRVSENALMRRYGISRPLLRRVLLRISAEGWIDRNEGRGWRFAALIDSVEAYRESYEFRQLIEVHGLRSPGFRFDRAVLDQLRQRQEFVRDTGWKTLSSLELFEMNSEFHEGLASLSGNRFLLPTIQKLNQLRRLVEYRQAHNTNQVLGQNNEHLAILDALDVEDSDTAARLMHAHLGTAKDRKARSDQF